MTEFDYAYAPPEPKLGTLLGAGLIAFVFEASVLFGVGWHQHWIAHPQNTGLDTNKFIEAQVFEAPPEHAHLVEEQKLAAPKPVTHEATLSKKPNQGREPKPGENAMTEKNITQPGPPPLATHGPVAVFAPTPAIPEYLKNQDLKATAVIDFYVTAQGGVNPRLVGSTGNEELDALAIATARKWQFRPAEQDHKPIDSKVRLRIVFEVK